MKFFYLLLMVFVSAPAAAEDIRIVMNMAYHGNEVADVKDKEPWIAVVEKDGRAIARRVKIAVKAVEDPFDETAGALTGREIMSYPDAVFAVKGIDWEDGAVIETYAFAGDMLQGGKSFELKGTKGTVTVSAIGDAMGKEGTTYQLLATIGGQPFPLTQRATNENLPHLLFAGDLNRDGYPDLLVDTALHYNMTRPTLFLSRVKGDAVMFEQVAQRESVGC